MSFTEKHYTDKTVPVQASNRVRLIERGDGTMNDLLYDLLHQGMCHGDEASVRDIIIAHLTKCRRRFSIDEKGNLISWVGKKVNIRTMFSCHMDVAKYNSGLIYPTITLGADGSAEGEGAGYIFGTKREPVYSFQNMETGELFTEKTVEQLITDPKVKYYGLRLVDKEQGICHLMKAKASYSHESSWKRIPNIPELKRVITSWKHTPSLVGADDKVGCYILCRLIENKIPGLYVWHVGEERGCIGSNWIVSHTPDRVQGIERCVAFDRRGYGDVISKQRSQNTASKEFTTALAKQLNQFVPGFQQFSGDIEGIYTDSAVYKDLIPECTNLSVGYWHEHTEREHFDLVWLEMLLIPAILRVKWNELPTVRDPKRVSTSTYGTHTYNRGPAGINYHRGGYLETEGEETYTVKDSRASNTNKDPKLGAHSLDDDPNSNSGGGLTDSKKQGSIEPIKTLSAFFRARGVPFTTNSIYEAKFWHDNKYVAPWEIQPNTGSSLIPPWFPSEGIYACCSKEQMFRIIYEHMRREYTTLENSAKLVYKLLCDIEEMEEYVHNAGRYSVH